eukprot:CAMPEP_0115316792 /NCGR_PEP_ID=MMETSP0270-20121206/78316_1 /TAXON_ID=71861 /ORGANISM="Scrippsiella trochoidea, Strain CCMP3099" /LENGTH=414 /DNA_ID=CAMNT_0002736231 /DNA_START=1 /DNA_END=1245 /DNA_ORIENTATION=+
MLSVTPRMPMAKRVEAIHGPTDNTNICVARTGEHVYLTNDQGVATNSIDPLTLNSLGHTAVQDSGAGMFTGAHKQAQSTFGSATFGWYGEITFTMGMKISVYRDQPTGDRNSPLTRTVIGTVEIHKPSMIHSFALTERYVIIVVGPVFVAPLKMVEYVANPEFTPLDMIEWDPTADTKFFIFDAASLTPVPPVAEMVSSAVFFNHHVNAYQGADGILRIDLIAYRDASFLKDHHGFGNLDVMKNATERAALTSMAPTFRRYMVDVSAGSGAHVPYNDMHLVDASGMVYSCEMPSVNPRRHGLPYCYGYFVGNQLGPGLVKVSLCAGGATNVIFWQRDGHHPGEPIFVPRPGGTSEDDGVLLSPVLDGAAERSYLLVLDAQTMEQLAAVQMPLAMPSDVHGLFWMDDAHELLVHV